MEGPEAQTGRGNFAQKVFNQRKQRAQQRNVFRLRSVLNKLQGSNLKTCEVRVFLSNIVGFLDQVPSAIYLSFFFFF